MKKSLILLSSIIILLSSCHKDTDGFAVAGALLGAGSYKEEKVNETPLLLSDDFLWRKNNLNPIQTIPESDFYFSENVFVSLHDAADDRTIWLNPDQENIPSKENSYFGEEVIVSNFSNGHTVINKATGDIIYQENLVPNGCESNPRRITGIGDLFFQVGTIPLPNDRFQDVIFLGNVNAPDKLEVALLPDFQTEIFNRDEGIGAIGGIQTIESQNGDILLAITYSEPTETNLENIFVGLWNYSTQQWIYKNILCMNHLGTADIYIKNNKMYCHNGLKIACYNLEDGALIWEKERKLSSMKYQFLDEVILIENGNLEIVNYNTGSVKPTSYDYISKWTASSKYIYIAANNNLNIVDLKSPTNVIKTIETPYLEYPDETPEYFKYPDALDVIEDKENKVDYIFININGYNFKIKMNH